MLVVTGASGFIGRRVVSLALAEGQAVRALCRDPASLADLTKTAPAGAGHTNEPDLEIIAWDIAQAGERPEVFADADAICHLAAFIPPDYGDPAHAERCFSVNVIGSTALLEAARQAGMRRFINLSSGNAYDPAARALTEDAPLYPSRHAAFYLASKVAAETIVDHYRAAGYLSTATLRVSSCYGAGMRGGFLKLCINRLRAGETIRLSDGGRHRADWVHVDDVAAAVLSAVHSDAEGPFNIGSGQAPTIRDVASTIAAALNVDPGLMIVEPSCDGPPGGTHPLNIERAKRFFSYAPRPFSLGVTDMLMPERQALPNAPALS